MKKHLLYISSNDRTSDLELNGAKLINNTVTGEWSPLFGSKVKLVVNNSYFYNNSGKQGGSLYFIDTDLIVDNSIFRLNNSRTISSGGHIYLSRGKSIIKNSEFYQAKVAKEGGASYIENHVSNFTNITC